MHVIRPTNPNKCVAMTFDAMVKKGDFGTILDELKEFTYRGVLGGLNGKWAVLNDGKKVEGLQSGDVVVSEDELDKFYCPDTN
jgi:hypothetical protein